VLLILLAVAVFIYRAGSARDLLHDTNTRAQLGQKRLAALGLKRWLIEHDRLGIAARQAPP
jgi:hypothetical protein